MLCSWNSLDSKEESVDEVSHPSIAILRHLSRSLNDALNLSVSFRPRLVTLGRCHGNQQRVANVTSQEDKECAQLSFRPLF